MPYCPSCHSEFRAGVERCPDCEELLVEALGGEPEDPLRPFELVAATPELLESLVAFLADLGVPARTSAAGVEVPGNFAAALLARLGERFEWEEDGARVRVLDEPPPDPEDAVDPDLLDRSVEDLEQRGDAALRQLQALLEKGAGPVKQVACRRLLLLYERAGRPLTEALSDAVRRGAKAEVFALTREIAERGPAADTALRIAELVPSLGTSGMLLALFVLGQIPDRRVAPLMLSLLEDEDAEIRAEADEVLCAISGADMAFDAGASATLRASATKRWSEWVRREVDGEPGPGGGLA